MQKVRDNKRMLSPCRGTLKKVISIITITAFFFTSTGFDLLIDSAWAVRTPIENPYLEDVPASKDKFNINSFILPKNLGTVEDKWCPSGKLKAEAGQLKAVIQIQDAHCNYNAQMKINEIIQYLDANYGVNVINLEGGAGEYDLTPFTDIPDPKVRKTVCDYFIKNGMVSGAESFAINSSSDVELWGIEDSELYLKNLGVYRDSLGYKGHMNTCLESIDIALDSLKVCMFSDELLIMDTEREDYADGRISFREYLDFIIKTSGEYNTGLEEFPNVRLLKKAVQAEGEISFKQAEKERAKLVDILKRTLSQEALKGLVVMALHFRKGLIDKYDFYEYLFHKAQMLKIDLAAFPEFSKYKAYVDVYSSIDKLEVINELDKLESKIKAGLYKNDKEKHLDLLAKDFSLLKKLFRLALTKADYKYYLANKNVFKIENFTRFIEEEGPEYDVKVLPDNEIFTLDSYRQKLEKFYEYSFERDEAFIPNLRMKSTSSGCTVLLTGGFHTENLCELLRENGISYVSIMPVFKNPKGYKCPYFERLSNGKTDEEEEIISFLTGSNIAIASFLNDLGAQANGRLDKMVKDLLVRWRIAKSEGRGFKLIAGEDAELVLVQGRETEIVNVTSFVTEKDEEISTVEEDTASDGISAGSWFRNKTWIRNAWWAETTVSLGIGFAAFILGFTTAAPLVAALAFWAPHLFFDNKEAAGSIPVIGLTAATYGTMFLALANPIGLLVVPALMWMHWEINRMNLWQGDQDELANLEKILEGIEEGEDDSSSRGETASLSASGTEEKAPASHSAKENLLKVLSARYGLMNDVESTPFAPLYSEIKDIFDILCAEAGVEGAELYLIENDSPQAFAIPSQGMVAISTGIFKFILSGYNKRTLEDVLERIGTASFEDTRLTRDSIAFILAHEIRHIAQKEIKGITRGGQIEKYADEIDADRWALEITDSAGFDVLEANKLFSLFQAMNKKRSIESLAIDIIDEHQTDETRIKTIEDTIASTNWRNAGSATELSSLSRAVLFARSPSTQILEEIKDVKDFSDVVELAGRADEVAPEYVPAILYYGSIMVIMQTPYGSSIKDHNRKWTAIGVLMDKNDVESYLSGEKSHFKRKSEADIYRALMNDDVFLSAREKMRKAYSAFLGRIENRYGGFTANMLKGSVFFAASRALGLWKADIMQILSSEMSAITEPGEGAGDALSFLEGEIEFNLPDLGRRGFKATGFYEANSSGQEFVQVAGKELRDTVLERELQNKISLDKAQEILHWMNRLMTIYGVESEGLEGDENVAEVFRTVVASDEANDSEKMNIFMRVPYVCRDAGAREIVLDFMIDMYFKGNTSPEVVDFIVSTGNYKPKILDRVGPEIIEELRQGNDTIRRTFYIDGDDLPRAYSGWTDREKRTAREKLEVIDLIAERSARHRGKNALDPDWVDMQINSTIRGMSDPEFDDFFNEKVVSSGAVTGIRDAENINHKIKRMLLYLALGGIPSRSDLDRLVEDTPSVKDLEMLAEFMASEYLKELHESLAVPRGDYRGDRKLLGKPGLDDVAVLEQEIDEKAVRSWEDLVAFIGMGVFLRKAGYEADLNERLILVQEAFDVRMFPEKTKKRLNKLEFNFDIVGLTEDKSAKSEVTRVYEVLLERMFTMPFYVDRPELMGLSLDSIVEKTLGFVGRSSKSSDELLDAAAMYLPAGKIRNFTLIAILLKAIAEKYPDGTAGKISDISDIAKLVSSDPELSEKAAVIMGYLAPDTRLYTVNRVLFSYVMARFHGKKESGIGSKESPFKIHRILPLNLRGRESSLDAMVYDAGARLRTLLKDIFFLLRTGFDLARLVFFPDNFKIGSRQMEILNRRKIAGLDEGEVEKELLKKILFNYYLEEMFGRIYRNEDLRWIRAAVVRYLETMRQRQGIEKIDVFFFDLNHPAKAGNLDATLPDLFLKDKIDAVVVSDADPAEKLEEIAKVFRDKQPARDRHLERMVEAELDKGISKEDKVEFLKRAARLFANKHFTRKYIFMAFEEARGMAGDISPYEEVALLEDFFPEKSYFRDDILDSILERLTFSRDHERLRGLYYRERRELVSDKDLQESVFFEEKTGIAIEELPARNKKELVLWIFGIGEKPLFIQEYEEALGVSFNRMKEMYILDFQSERYPRLGETPRRIFMERLFLGPNGVLGDEKVFMEMNKSVLESILSKMEKGRVPKDLIRKIFRSVMENSDKAKRMDIVDAISDNFAEVIGGEEGSYSDVEIVTALMESMGIIGIKVAQILAFSGDIELPEDLRESFRRLSSKADPLKKQVAFESLSRIGGKFQQMEVKDLLGAASIKVVFSALDSEGRKVALKLKRPDVAHNLDLDLKLFRKVSSDLRSKGIKIPEGFEDRASEGIASDADFIREIESSRRLAEQVEDINRENMYETSEGTPVEFAVPEVYEGSNEKMIITSLVEGEELDEALTGKSGLLSEEEIRDVKRIVFDVLMTQLFSKGFYLSDPHGGNFMVAKEEGRIKIYFIDTGAMEESRIDKESLGDMLLDLALLKRGLKASDEFLWLAIFFEKTGYLTEGMDWRQMLGMIFDKMPEGAKPYKDIAAMEKTLIANIALRYFTNIFSFLQNRIKMPASLRNILSLVYKKDSLKMIYRGMPVPDVKSPRVRAIEILAIALLGLERIFTNVVILVYLPLIFINALFPKTNRIMEILGYPVAIVKNLLDSMLLRLTQALSDEVGTILREKVKVELSDTEKGFIGGAQGKDAVLSAGQAGRRNIGRAIDTSGLRELNRTVNFGPDGMYEVNYEGKIQIGDLSIPVMETDVIRDINGNVIEDNGIVIKNSKGENVIVIRAGPQDEVRAALMHEFVAVLALEGAVDAEDEIDPIHIMARANENLNLGATDQDINDYYEMLTDSPLGRDQVLGREERRDLAREIKDGEAIVIAASAVQGKGARESLSEEDLFSSLGEEVESVDFEVRYSPNVPGRAAGSWFDSPWWELIAPIAETAVSFAAGYLALGLFGNIFIAFFAAAAVFYLPHLVFNSRAAASPAVAVLTGATALAFLLHAAGIAAPLALTAVVALHLGINLTAKLLRNDLFALSDASGKAAAIMHLIGIVTVDILRFMSSVIVRSLRESDNSILERTMADGARGFFIDENPDETPEEELEALPYFEEEGVPDLLMGRDDGVPVIYRYSEDREAAVFCAHGGVVSDGRVCVAPRDNMVTVSSYLRLLKQKGIKKVLLFSCNAKQGGFTVPHGMKVEYSLTLVKICPDGRKIGLWTKVEAVDGDLEVRGKTEGDLERTRRKFSQKVSAGIKGLTSNFLGLFGPRFSAGSWFDSPWWAMIAPFVETGALMYGGHILTGFLAGIVGVNLFAALPVAIFAAGIFYSMHNFNPEVKNSATVKALTLFTFAFGAVTFGTGLASYAIAVLFAAHLALNLYALKDEYIEAAYAVKRLRRELQTPGIVLSKEDILKERIPFLQKLKMNPLTSLLVSALAGVLHIAEAVLTFGGAIPAPTVNDRAADEAERREADYRQYEQQRIRSLTGTDARGLWTAFFSPGSVFGTGKALTFAWWGEELLFRLPAFMALLKIGGPVGIAIFAVFNLAFVLAHLRNLRSYRAEYPESGLLKSLVGVIGVPALLSILISAGILPIAVSSPWIFMGLSMGAHLLTNLFIATLPSLELWPGITGRALDVEAIARKLARMYPSSVDNADLGKDDMVHFRFYVDRNISKFMAEINVDMIAGMEIIERAKEIVREEGLLRETKEEDQEELAGETEDVGSKAPTYRTGQGLEYDERVESAAIKLLGKFPEELSRQDLLSETLPIAITIFLRDDLGISDPVFKSYVLNSAKQMADKNNIAEDKEDSAKVKTEKMSSRKEDEATVQENRLIVKDDTRLVAHGDVHGELDGLKENLIAAKLIDESGNWIGGNAVLVQQGDVIDRGPKSREAYEFLIGLQQQARDAGGDVVILLGNHELMLLQGHLRYLYETLTRREGLSHREAEDEIRRLRGRLKDLIARGNIVGAYHEKGYLFVHGGLRTKIREYLDSEVADQKGISPGSVTENERKQRINEVLKMAVESDDYSHPIFNVDRSRGGRHEVGGIFWTDYRDLAGSFRAGEQPQQVGHSPERRPGAGIRGTPSMRRINGDAGLFEGYGGNRAFVSMENGDIKAVEKQEDGVYRERVIGQYEVPEEEEPAGETHWWSNWKARDETAPLKDRELSEQKFDVREEVDIKALAPGTIIRMKDKTSWVSYTLRVEEGGMVSMWLMNNTGCFVGPANEIGDNGVIKKNRILAFPYFLYDESVSPRRLIAFEEKRHRPDQLAGWAHSFDEFSVISPPSGRMIAGFGGEENVGRGLDLDVYSKNRMPDLSFGPGDRYRVEDGFIDFGGDPIAVLYSEGDITDSEGRVIEDSGVLVKGEDGLFYIILRAGPGVSEEEMKDAVLHEFVAALSLMGGIDAETESEAIHLLARDGQQLNKKDHSDETSGLEDEDIPAERDEPETKTALRERLTSIPDTARILKNGAFGILSCFVQFARTFVLGRPLFALLVAVTGIMAVQFISPSGESRAPPAPEQTASVQKTFETQVSFPANQLAWSLRGAEAFLGEVSKERIEASIERTNSREYQVLVNEAYDILVEKGLWDAEETRFPILFLRGLERPGFAMAKPELGLNIVGDAEFSKLKTRQQRVQWICEKIPHENQHIINRRDRPGISLLEDEALAYKVTWESAKVFYGEDHPQTKAQEEVYRAFDLLARQEGLRGEAGELLHLYRSWGLGENINFEDIYYDHISFKDGKVMIGLYSLRDKNLRVEVLVDVEKSSIWVREKADQPEEDTDDIIRDPFEGAFLPAVDFGIHRLSPESIELLAAQGPTAPSRAFAPGDSNLLVAGEGGSRNIGRNIDISILQEMQEDISFGPEGRYKVENGVLRIGDISVKVMLADEIKDTNGNIINDNGIVIRDRSGENIIVIRAGPEEQQRAALMHEFIALLALEGGVDAEKEIDPIHIMARDNEALGLELTNEQKEEILDELSSEKPDIILDPAEVSARERELENGRAVIVAANNNAETVDEIPGEEPIYSKQQLEENAARSKFRRNVSEMNFILDLYYGGVKIGIPSESISVTENKGGVPFIRAGKYISHYPPRDDGIPYIYIDKDTESAHIFGHGNTTIDGKWCLFPEIDGEKRAIPVQSYLRALKGRGIKHVKVTACNPFFNGFIIPAGMEVEYPISSVSFDYELHLGELQHLGVWEVSVAPEDADLLIGEDKPEWKYDIISKARRKINRYLRLIKKSLFPTREQSREQPLEYSIENIPLAPDTGPSESKNAGAFDTDMSPESGSDNEELSPFGLSDGGALAALTPRGIVLRDDIEMSNELREWNIMHENWHKMLNEETGVGSPEKKEIMAAILAFHGMERVSDEHLLALLEAFEVEGEGVPSLTDSDFIKGVIRYYAETRPGYRHLLSSEETVLDIQRSILRQEERLDNADEFFSLIKADEEIKEVLFQMLSEVRSSHLDKRYTDLIRRKMRAMSRSLRRMVTDGYADLDKISDALDRKLDDILAGYEASLATIDNSEKTPTVAAYNKAVLRHIIDMDPELSKEIAIKLRALTPEAGENFMALLERTRTVNELLNLLHVYLTDVISYSLEDSMPAETDLSVFVKENMQYIWDKYLGADSADFDVLDSGYFKIFTVSEDEVIVHIREFGHVTSLLIKGAPEGEMLITYKVAQFMPNSSDLLERLQEMGEVSVLASGDGYGNYGKGQFQSSLLDEADFRGKMVTLLSTFGRLDMEEDAGAIEADEVSAVPLVVQLEAMKQLLQDEEFAREMAEWQNGAYYRGIGEEPPEFEPTQENIAMNMAGFYAVECGVGVICERTRQTPMEVLEMINNGTLPEEDMLLIARFANGTWKAGQPFRGLDRIRRDTFRPAAMLTRDELAKDFDQIKAASEKLYEGLQKNIFDGLSDDERKDLDAKIDDLVYTIKSNGDLSDKELNDIRDTARMVNYAHRFQRRKTGIPYFNHQLQVTKNLVEIFGVTDPVSVQVALLHDTREDQESFYNDFRSGLRGAILAREMPEYLDEATHKLDAISLGVRLLSNLEAQKYKEAFPDKQDREREYFRRMVDPKSVYNDGRAGSDEWYTDGFIHNMQLIKVSDRITNIRDLAGIFTAGEEVTREKTRAFPAKTFNKTFATFIPELIENEGNKLTSGEVDTFYTEFIKALDDYVALEEGEHSENAQPLINAAKEARARLVYSSAERLAPAMINVINRDAPTYDIAPADFEGQSKVVNMLNRLERTTGKRGHLIKAEFYTFGDGEDWVSNMKDQIARTLPDFYIDVLNKRTTRMTLRLLEGESERSDIRQFILEELANIIDPDGRDAGGAMEKARNILDVNILMISENITDAEHLNNVIDLFADIAIMEVDRYEKGDYRKEAMPDSLKIDLVRLLKLSASNMDDLTVTNLVDTLQELFRGAVLKIRAIDWESIRDWKDANDEVLRSL